MARKPPRKPWKPPIKSARTTLPFPFSSVFPGLAKGAKFPSLLDLLIEHQASPAAYYLPWGTPNPQVYLAPSPGESIFAPGPTKTLIHEGLHAYSDRPGWPPTKFSDRRLGQFLQNWVNAVSKGRPTKETVEGILPQPTLESLYLNWLGPVEAYASVPQQYWKAGRPIPKYLQSFYPFKPGYISPLYRGELIAEGEPPAGAREQIYRGLGLPMPSLTPLASSFGPVGPAPALRPQPLLGPSPDIDFGAYGLPKSEVLRRRSQYLRTRSRKDIRGY